MNKSKCRGCDQDRYNHKGLCEREGIDAVVTSDECWHLKDAKVIWRVEIPIHQIPPYTQKARRFPSCYSTQGYTYISPDKLKGGYIR